MALPFTFTAFTLISAAQVNANFTYLDGLITALTTTVSGKLAKASNLSDLANAATARTNLGLGTAATQATGTSGATVPLLNGANTWSTTQTFTLAPIFTDQSGTRTALGLGTVSVLTSGVATGNVAPVAAGTVLQEVVITDVGTTGTNTSFANFNAANVVIVPKSAASQFILTVSFYGSISVTAGVNPVGTFQLFDVTNAALIGQPYEVWGAISGGGIAAAAPSCIAAIVSNAVLTSRSFQLQAKSSVGTSTVRSTSMVWSIREIKT